ncbi:MAG: HyaD/HybD family hydrogenase maturation endopeptidase [Gammaproteobacteria bacterium]|nr:HyaD/HybD family hydrogenase maturation endopeptidase [Gammaproteobacteria bacterium]MBT3488844.1 HyaD/HybD family hydrogenase maturation endopeptidase [Gammaproteobacteria bacterium]MBT3718811.1 HyaD/HybD family hydrogenase maturation endopeptidase [Gammaproteobacteria bacterium]MBT3845875.1 HyaD/HybD family hydrogenase maturation endopeptidase [Gammaproteobacteria bacterium]MBT3894248.1 HyaD/HybD family hydrogenase maturation endopeptidase [Gammaproteobacteria bacterium]
MMRKILVLGLGNTLLGDEGVGVRVIERLAEENLIPNVELMDGGTLSFTLAGPIAEADQLIVVDAANLQAESGSVQAFVNEEMDHFIGTGKMSSVHEVSLLDLLSITALSGELPTSRALVGVQPEFVDWSEALTPAVEKGVEQAVDEVKRLLKEWTDE